MFFLSLYFQNIIKHYKIKKNQISTQRKFSFYAKSPEFPGKKLQFDGTLKKLDFQGVLSHCSKDKFHSPPMTSHKQLLQQFHVRFMKFSRCSIIFTELCKMPIRRRLLRRAAMTTRGRPSTIYDVSGQSPLGRLRRRLRQCHGTDRPVVTSW